MAAGSLDEKVHVSGAVNFGWTNSVQVPWKGPVVGQHCLLVQTRGWSMVFIVVSEGDQPGDPPLLHGPGDGIHGTLGLLGSRRPGPDVVPGEDHKIRVLVVEDHLHEPYGSGIDLVIILGVRELDNLEGSIGPEPEPRGFLPAGSRDLALRVPLLNHTP